MAHAGASRCIAARCHRYGVSHRMSHTQDGGRLRVLVARRAARMRSPVAPTEFYGKKSLNRRLV